MSYRVMGRMEDGQDHCFGRFPNEESACQWCDHNEQQYPETRLFVEPTRPYVDADYDEGECYD